MRSRGGKNQVQEPVQTGFTSEQREKLNNSHGAKVCVSVVTAMMEKCSARQEIAQRAATTPPL